MDSFSHQQDGAAEAAGAADGGEHGGRERGGELSLELLKAVSRSFYLSMVWLPRPMRRGIALGYLLARATDSVADSSGAALSLRETVLEAMGRSIAAASPPADEEALLRALLSGGYACGAFCGQTLVGYLLVLPERFGSRGQYIELKEFYVSEPYRGRGIGRELFARGVAYARAAGAQKLYISAHSSRESQAAYRRLGCVPTPEPDPARAAREPCDVQMEYLL